MVCIEFGVSTHFVAFVDHENLHAIRQQSEGSISCKAGHEYLQTVVGRRYRALNWLR